MKSAASTRQPSCSRRRPSAKRLWRSTSVWMVSSSLAHQVHGFRDVRSPLHITLTENSIGAIHERTRSSSHDVSHCCTIRGGAKAADDEDAEENARLDAYIETLLASVDDSTTAEDDSAAQSLESSSRKTTMVPTKTKSTKRITKSKPKEKQGTLKVKASKPKTNKPSSSPGTSQSNKVSENPVSSTSSQALSKGVAEESDEQNQDNNDAESDSTLKQTDNSQLSHETTPKGDQVNHERQPSATAPTPIPTTNILPNPLFRFLLNRGMVGHVLVMLCVLLLEWIQLYLPMIAHALDALYARIVPKRHRIKSTRRRRTVVADSAAALARTGTSRKKRQELTRQADQVALEQLQSLSADSRYAHVSDAFMKRHHLGAYQRDADVVEAEMEDEGSALLAEDSEDVEGTSRKRKQKKVLTKTKRKAKVRQRKDWVIEALTREISPSSSKTSIRPTVSINLGANGGLSLGLELGNTRDRRDQYRKSVVEAVVAPDQMPRVSRRRNTGVSSSSSAVASTSDASRGLMGNIRSSALSRRLLGAYPGDALSLDEAADVHGVGTFAQRYGYDEHSSLWDENDDTLLKVSKRRRKKRSRVKLDQNEADDLFDSLPGLLDSEDLPSMSSKKTSRTPIFSPTEQIRKAKSQTAKRVRRSSQTNNSHRSSRKKKQTRHTTERVHQSQSKRSKPKKEEDRQITPKLEKSLPKATSMTSSSSAMDRLNEIRARGKPGSNQ